MLKYTILAPLLLLLAACSTSIDKYADTSPSFLLESYFDGKMIAKGMIQNHKDKITRRFCVEMTNTWKKNGSGLTGTLEEVFYFDDGEEQIRIWTIEKEDIDKPHYIGSAADVKGQARGEISGMAFQWKYTLMLEKPKKLSVKVDDWIYLLDDNTAINRSKLFKWGLHVADVTLYFDKTQQQCPR